jgi:hypothetical protein
MRKISIIPAMLAAALIFSCASFPKADNEHQTLVIGTIIQEGKGYQMYGSTSVNGTNKSGIEFTIQELNGEKTYTLRTRSDGIFYSINIPEGEYKITRLFLRNEAGSAWASIEWTPLAAREIRIGIVNSKVNNLGSISWECENNVRNQISYNREYGQVRDLFQEKNKSSNWNEKEWTNINVYRVDLPQ